MLPAQVLGFDAAEADLSGLLLAAGVLTVVTLVLAYAVAWWWHRFRDPQGRSE